MLGLSQIFRADDASFRDGIYAAPDLRHSIRIAFIIVKHLMTIMLAI